MLSLMETSPQPPEDLAQLIRRVMDEKGIAQAEIARRAGVSVSAVSTWVNRKRGAGRGPSRDILHRLAAALGEPERRVFEAAKRKTPGPISPDAEQNLLEYFRDLTEEQQHAKLVEMRALAEDNRSTDR